MPAASYVLYRTGAALAGTVPEAVSFPVAEAAGVVAGRLNGRRREVVRRNLRRVVGPERLEATVDAAFRSYARYWVETLRIPKPGPDEIRRRTTSEGLDALRGHLDEHRGIVFCTPHLGSWDVAGAWLASHGWRIVVVAERLDPPELYDLFVGLRRQVGLEVHALGEASTGRALIKALREGAAVGLVADRDLTGSGIEVDFFGEKTFMPSGPAVLALRTGVPLVAGALFQRPGGRYHGVVLDPLPTTAGRDAGAVAELTQALARQFEDLIRRDPGQWHLFQPNWPSDPGYRTESGA